jgi:hypothetical protein
MATQQHSTARRQTLETPTDVKRAGVGGALGGYADHFRLVGGNVLGAVAVDVATDG